MHVSPLSKLHNTGNERVKLWSIPKGRPAGHHEDSCTELHVACRVFLVFSLSVGILLNNHCIHQHYFVIFQGTCKIISLPIIFLLKPPKLPKNVSVYTFHHLGMMDHVNKPAFFGNVTGTGFRMVKRDAELVPCNHVQNNDMWSCRIWRLYTMLYNTRKLSVDL